MSIADDFHFEIATATDLDEITALVASHYRGPLFEALDAQTEDLEEAFTQLVEKCLEYPVSLVVRNNEKKIIAVQLAFIIKRSDDAENSEMHGTTLSETSVKAKVLKFLKFIEKDTWDLMPSDINCLLRIEITLVIPEYLRRGIARHMTTMRMDTAKELGCQGLTTTSVSLKSQRLRMSEGFNVLKEIMYKDWLDDNGTVVFETNDGSESAVLMFMRL